MAWQTNMILAIYKILQNLTPVTGIYSLISLNIRIPHIKQHVLRAMPSDQRQFNDLQLSNESELVTREVCHDVQTYSRNIAHEHTSVKKQVKPKPACGNFHNHRRSD